MLSSSKVVLAHMASRRAQRCSAAAGATDLQAACRAVGRAPSGGGGAAAWALTA